MADNDIPVIPRLQQAPRGSKVGWVQITGQIPPSLDALVIALEARGYQRTNIVHEAIAQFCGVPYEPAA